jgi:NADH:ubiquinone oxidoreductase subunit 4 (subunit M)
MNWVNMLPLLVVLTTLGTGIVIFLLPEQSRRLRTTLNLTGAGDHGVRGGLPGTVAPPLRFFGFFSLCVTATVGVAMSGNLLTFLVFFELLTLTTYPLLVHRGTEAARQAGIVYLAHTVFAGVLLLAGTVWLYTLTGTLDVRAPRLRQRGRRQPSWSS